MAARFVGAGALRISVRMLTSPCISESSFNADARGENE